MLLRPPSAQGREAVIMPAMLETDWTAREVTMATQRPYGWRRERCRSTVGGRSTVAEKGGLFISTSTVQTFGIISANGMLYQPLVNVKKTSLPTQYECFQVLTDVQSKGFHVSWTHFCILYLGYRPGNIADLTCQRVFFYSSACLREISYIFPRDPQDLRYFFSW